MTNKYDNKHENKLLINILNKYVENNGAQLVALNAYQFSSLDPELFVGLLQITKQKIHSAQNSDSRYIKNLELKNFIIYKPQSPFNFCLTLSGYEEALRLKSPKTYFCKKHWGFLLGILLSFIVAITAVLRLIQC